MDFNKLSQKYKSIKSPTESQNLSQASKSQTQGLLEVIKREDAKSRKQSKRFYLITSITALVYVLVFIVNPDPDLTLANRIAGGCFIVAAVILALLFRKKHKQLEKISYLSSPKTFLEHAKKRFQFWNLKQLWLVVIIILVDVASIISLSNYFDLLSQTKGIILYQLLFLGMLVFGFFMGKREWEKHKKPTFAKIEEMLSGFAEEN